MVVVVAGVALALFEPWRLFTRSSIDEAAPVAAAANAGSRTANPTPLGTTIPPTPSGGSAADGAPADSSPDPTADASGGAPSGTPMAPPAPTSFVDGEHPTSGTAEIVRAADGRRYVRLEGFSTSDGPDVHVILSDVASGQADWGLYDDGRWVELGELKATDGNQNYEIPADVDLAGLRSVVIWCDRFDVAFGTAPLAV